ncbi:MAG TPA: polysaccharide deacetylase family protein [Ktedonobacterales bacterium]|nr:polysaccharide deacetylase family protein [Ktedonobacterales bacterium]
MDGADREPSLVDGAERSPAALTLDAALAAWKAALATTVAALATVVTTFRAAWMRWRPSIAAPLLVAAMLATSGSALVAGPRASNFAAHGPPPIALAGASFPDANPALSRGVKASRTTGALGDSVRSAYNGSVEFGQGCPGGQAPKPANWAIGSAGDYGAPRLNTVALTFDDGPSPSSSPAILSFLERTHTPATFFVLGQYARAYPSLIRREAADGFTIGIHTWSHPNMRLLTPAQRAWQLTATVQQLRADLGPGFCVWLWRPPYESFDTTIVRQAGSYGLTTILWNVDPADWARPGAMTIVNRVLAQVRPGSIILLHDGPADRQQTAAALPYILTGLRQRGLSAVSLPQLLLGYQPLPITSLTATPNPTATLSSSATPRPAEAPKPTAAATATASPAIAQAAAAAPAPAPTPPTLNGYPIAPYTPGWRFGGWRRMGGGG